MSDLEDALARAIAMPQSIAKMDALELLARQADQRNDNRLAFRVRHHLFFAAYQMSQYRNGLAAYAWMRATFEKDPTVIDRDYLLRLGAYVVDSLDPYVEIPLTQIEALYAEQEELYRAHRRPLTALHFARVSTEISLGRLEHARRAYEAWGNEPLDFCEGCIHARHVHFWVSVGDDERAIEFAKPLTHGGVRCDNQPVGVMHDLLLPHARRGDWEIARRYHERAHRHTMGQVDSPRSAADLITYSAAIGTLGKAKNLLERGLQHVVEYADNLSKLIFYTAVVTYLEAVRREGPMLSITLPRDFPVQPTSGKRVDVVALKSWFETTAGELARKFDERNENDYFSTKLANSAVVLDELDPPGRSPSPA